MMYIVLFGEWRTTDFDYQNKTQKTPFVKAFRWMPSESLFSFSSAGFMNRSRTFLCKNNNSDTNFYINIITWLPAAIRCILLSP